ncbi:hypothetical protein [Mesorhizobium sp. CAU 1741]|uniref:hypothetical protein n=1 Tax=Mesorhizobium sp. CAU 1741 TaxID=3140366 RepID=UPI00325C2EE2
MEHHSLVRRVESDPGEPGYMTPPVADELKPVVQALGKWAHRNINKEVSLKKLDARLLMWNMRRKIDASAFPRCTTKVVQFTYVPVSKTGTTFAERWQACFVQQNAAVRHDRQRQQRQGICRLLIGG